MNELFRFFTLRPVSAPGSDPSLVSIPLRDPGAGLSLVQLAQSNRVISKISELPAAEELASIGNGLLDALRAMRPDPGPTSIIEERVSPLLRVDPTRGQPSADAMLNRLDASIIVGKWQAGPQRELLRTLSMARRMSALLEFLRGGGTRTPSRETILGYLQAPLILPERWEKGPFSEARPNTSPTRQDSARREEVRIEQRKKIETLLEKRNTLSEARKVLRSLPSSSFLRPAPAEKTPPAPKLGAKQGKPAITLSAKELGASLSAGNDLVLSKSAASALPPQVVASLGAVGISGPVSVRAANFALSAAQARIQSDIAKILPDVFDTPDASDALAAALRRHIGIFRFPFDSGKLSFPAGPSRIEAVGRADLLLVRERTKGYVRADLSYVENVMPGEAREREHVRRTQVETLSVRESEEEISQEKDLQASERFELSSEAERTIKSELVAKGEASVTATYGPHLEVQLGGSVAQSEIREESRKQAQEFSREIVDRTVARVRSKVRELRQTRILEEVTERNRHLLENKTSAPFAGIYQWIDKIVEAQVMSYGERTMYDLIVPEPAAFFLAAQQAKRKESTAAKEPEPFLVSPDNLDESNYADLAAKYGASDVSPMPEELLSVSVTLQNMREENWYEGVHVENKAVDVPAGYIAEKAIVHGVVLGDETSFVYVAVGAQQVSFGTLNHIEALTLDGAEGDIPTGCISYSAATYLVHIEIVCRVTPRKIATWQLETHEKIRVAYEQQRAEFHAAQARASSEALERIRGQNPLTVRRIMDMEIKRSCVTLFANRSPEGDALQIDAAGIPHVDPVGLREHAPLVRFLEQCFEWEHMSYVLYPYYWGRKEPDLWKHKITAEDADPIFLDFIQSGAARVLLPVREGFQEAVHHFMMSGEPYLGREIVGVHDALYVPLAVEQRARTQGGPEPVAVGEPWDVRIPTALVILRSGTDGALPQYGEVEGRWQELG